MPEMPVFMRYWRMVLPAMLWLLPLAAGADYARGPVQWRASTGERWQLDVTVRTSASVTQAVEHILAVDAYGTHSQGQLAGSITRADGQRYLVEIAERRFGMPAAVVSHSRLELALRGPSQLGVRAVGGLYSGLQGGWYVQALPGGGALVHGAFELAPTAQQRESPPFMSALQRQDPRFIMEGWLELWVRALGLPAIGP